jgi:hypothetical protein
MEQDQRPNYTALVTMGFSANVADALDERGVTAEDARHLSAQELLEHFFEWEGIIGFTRTIIDAVDECREVAARRR